MKVEAISSNSVSPKVLLAQIAERDDVDSIVAVVRADGSWRSVWTSNVSLSSLSMAALKLMNDVMVEMHREGDSPHIGFSGPETD